MQRMRASPTAGCMVETRKIGGEEQVRIRKLRRPTILTANVVPIYEEAMEHLKELAKIPHGSITTFAVTAVARHTELLIRLMKRLHEEIEK